MKYILKLNMMSAMYALLIFYLVQSLGNFYRIARLTGWETETVNQAIVWGGLGNPGPATGLALLPFLHRTVKFFLSYFSDRGLKCTS